MAVAGKRIVAAGSLDEVKAALGDQPFTVDETFKSKVVMPGFIDQHLHPILGALTLAVAVIAPEDWVLPSRTYQGRRRAEAEYRARLEGAEAELASPTDWLHHLGLPAALARQSSTATSSTASASTRPIAVWHRSCHEFFFNSAALDALGITEATTQGQGRCGASSRTGRRAISGKAAST